MTLDVIIATYKPEGIERVSKMELPVVEDVNYIVSWQAHQDYPVPENLIRKDIKIFRMNDIGLSRNRNNAINHSSADIIYIADDDVEILPGALDKIRERFMKFPDTDVASFRMKGSEGKIYPKDVRDLLFYLPKNYYINSIELAFRRQLYPSLRFNELFGINSGVFGGGEEEIFHLEARKRGLVCRFFPDTIVSHPHATTGLRKVEDPKIVEGFGAVLSKSYPGSFILRIPLKAYRLKKNNQYGFFKSIFFLVKGVVKARKIKL